MDTCKIFFTQNTDFSSSYDSILGPWKKRNRAILLPIRGVAYKLCFYDIKNLKQSLWVGGTPKVLGESE